MSRARQFGVFRSTSIIVATAYVIGFGASLGSAAERDSAREILEATGVQGGFIVHVGSGDGKLTAALRINERFLVHGLDADPTLVANARQQTQLERACTASGTGLAVDTNSLLAGGGRRSIVSSCRSWNSGGVGNTSP